MHGKMMKLMELFRTCGLLNSWKSSEYHLYTVRSKAILRANFTKSIIKSENLCLTLNEMKSLFSFTSLEEAVACLLVIVEIKMIHFKKQAIILIFFKMLLALKVN